MLQANATFARRALLPTLLLLGLLVTPLAAFAQDSSMMGQDQTMNTTMVMVPTGGSDMMMVTVRMPMEMMGMSSGMGMGMATMTQPIVRRIPGGYEIDYGGPSIIIQRDEQN